MSEIPKDESIEVEAGSLEPEEQEIFRIASERLHKISKEEGRKMNLMTDMVPVVIAVAHELYPAKSDADRIRAVHRVVDFFMEIHRLYHTKPAGGVQ